MRKSREPGSNEPNVHEPTPGEPWHDQRMIDLVAVLALVILMASALMYFNRPNGAAPQTSLIVPGQSVRW